MKKIIVEKDKCQFCRKFVKLYQYHTSNLCKDCIFEYIIEVCCDNCHSHSKLFSHKKGKQIQCLCEKCVEDIVENNFDQSDDELISTKKKKVNSDSFISEEEEKSSSEKSD